MVSAIGNFQCEKSNSAVTSTVSVFLLSNSRHSRVIRLISQLLSVGSMKQCLWAMGPNFKPIKPRGECDHWHLMRETLYMVSFDDDAYDTVTVYLLTINF